MYNTCQAILEKKNQMQQKQCLNSIKDKTERYKYESPNSDFICFIPNHTDNNSKQKSSVLAQLTSHATSLTCKNNAFGITRSMKENTRILVFNYFLTASLF